MIDHDITHCAESSCANKDTCFRYQAHLDAMKRGFYYLSYYSKPKELECYKKL